jgi:hypothetical protein
MVGRDEGRGGECGRGVERRGVINLRRVTEYGDWCELRYFHHGLGHANAG